MIFEGHFNLFSCVSKIDKLKYCQTFSFIEILSDTHLEV